MPGVTTDPWVDESKGKNDAMYRRSRIRRVAAIIGGMTASLVVASSVMAFECFNASKADQSAGAQVIFGPTMEILYITPGLARRIDQGLVDAESGEGFHGIVGFDVNGDDVVDFSTWFGVGWDGEIPLEAQLRGPACRGLTNIGLFATEC